MLDFFLTAIGVSIYFAVAFRLAAHLALISWDSLLLPAAVIPPFFCGDLWTPSTPPPLILAQRNLAAAPIFSRVAADMRR